MPYIQDLKLPLGNISSYTKINVKKKFCANIIYIYLQLTDKRPSELAGKSNSADSAGFIMMTSLPASPWQPTTSTLINPAVVYSPEVELYLQQQTLT